VTQRELRNNSGQIMARLDEGETFVVTRNGIPVGELSPLRGNRFVKAGQIARVFRGAPRIDQKAFRADLDAVASQAVDPRA